jgi:hypothetical protein
LSGPYCSRCGQKQIRGGLTLRGFIEEVTRDFSHWDAKLPRTLKTLFLQPGPQTIDVIAGRRARWLAPLRVYVICSLAYFLARPLEEAIQKRSAREFARITITNSDGSRTLTDEARRDIAQGLPGRIFGVERLERAAADQRGLESAFLSAFPKAMFILVPMFAWPTSVAWRTRRLSYPAHLYAAVHIHAAWFGALAAGTLAAAFIPSDTVADIVEAALWPYLLWHVLVALRRVFGDSWPRTVFKSIAVLAVYVAALFAVSLGLLGYAVMRM